MHYYDVFILAGIYAVLAVVDCIIELKSNRFSKKIRPWQRIAVVVSIILTLSLAWTNRTPRELLHYDRLLTSDSIRVEKADKTETVAFKYDAFAGMFGLGSAPVYADEDDFTTVCTLEFTETGRRGSITMRLCRLNRTDGYPDDMIFRYDGDDYCFLSNQFLYHNAFYRLNRHHALAIIEAVL